MKFELTGLRPARPFPFQFEEKHRIESANGRRDGASWMQGRMPPWTGMNRCSISCTLLIRGHTTARVCGFGSDSIRILSVLLGLLVLIGLGSVTTGLAEALDALKAHIASSSSSVSREQLVRGVYRCFSAA